MELNDVWGLRPADQCKVKENLRRDLHGDIGCLEGCRRVKMRGKLCSGIFAICAAKRLPAPDAGRRRYSAIIGMTLIL